MVSILFSRETNWYICVPKKYSPLSPYEENNSMYQCIEPPRLRVFIAKRKKENLYEYIKVV